MSFQLKKEPKEKLKSFSVRLPEDLIDRLELVSKEEKVPLVSIVRQVLEWFADEHKPKVKEQL